MAKKYYRRRYRRRGRWSSNIQPISETFTAEPGVTGNSYTIAQNPAQSNNTVSIQYTAKNIEAAFCIETLQSTTGAIDDLTYYIMYVPQGYTISLDLPLNHPEWIMAYKFIGNSQMYVSNSNPYQVPKIKTRLARRLNTGDSIIFLWTANNNGTSSISFKESGLLRWWTKAN